MSQFRRDPVSEEWVVIAPERARRPDDKKKKVKKTCPFDDLEKSGNWPPILSYEEKGEWRAILIQNKFPALVHGNKCPKEKSVGPYLLTDGLGYHELLITRDHKNDFPRLSEEDAYVVFEMLAERYRTIDKDLCMRYLSTFCNWGPGSGASQEHPHYQLLAMPILPPGVENSLENSRRYFSAHKKCAHCEVLKFENKAKKRIVAENSSAIAIAPYASYSPFEVRIFPKSHLPAFENSPKQVLRDVSRLLQIVLRRMREELKGPSYNFLIHSSPLIEQKKYSHYHWHIEVLPKTSSPGGFERATGTYINSADPEAVAKMLRQR